MMATIDLNCDMGEGFGPWPMGNDEAMLDVVSSANVACGFHAGDPSTMFRTAALAKRKGVALGAHPGFNDLAGFGRRVIKGDSPAEIERMIAYQIGAMQAVAALAAHRVTYVKIHGALYNMANVDEILALAVAKAIKGVDPTLVNVCMPGLLMERESERLGMKVAKEFFADRAYEEDGTLVSRAKPGAMIHDPEAAAERVLNVLQEKALVTASGRRIQLAVDTVCVHGDGPSAVDIARAIRAKLEANGFAIVPFTSG